MTTPLLEGEIHFPASRADLQNHAAEEEGAIPLRRQMRKGGMVKCTEKRIFIRAFCQWEEEQRMKKFARIRLQERRKEPQLFFMRFFAFFAGFYAEKRKGTDIKRYKKTESCRFLSIVTKTRRTVNMNFGRG